MPAHTSEAQNRDGFQKEMDLNDEDRIPAISQFSDLRPLLGVFDLPA